MKTKMSKNEIPPVISVRTAELAPLLAKWRDENRGVPWGVLLRRSLACELEKLAGKRYAQLIEDAKAA